MISKKDLKKIQDLKDKINYYDSKYYEEGVSEISDAEYDRLYKEYEEFEKKYPELKNQSDAPTRKVGAGSNAGLSTGLPKFTHKSPLLSIDRKAKELSELKDFYEKIGGDGTEVIIEPKFDGITCNINYENGKFVNAATRGNGYIGDLITNNFINTNAKYPNKVDCNEFEVRGEAIIPYDYFKKHLIDDYSNPRNAVSGIMRQIDSNDVKDKGVEVIFYDVGKTDKSLSEEDFDNTYTLKEMGFQDTPCYLVATWKALKEIVESRLNGMIKEIDGFNVLIADGYPQAVCDGLVIKVNHLKEREEIGYSEKGPKWAFAYKFKPLQAITCIEEIEWQVGKTGKITPVANFRTVSLGGTKINRATLNNYDYMCNLPTVKQNGELDLENTIKVGAGDLIVVERSNDVIPRIVAVKKHFGSDTFEPQDVKIQEENHRKRETFNEPKICPICGGRVEKVGPLHFCNNYDCPKQIKRRIEHFASRDAMNIVGLGESIVDQLYEKKGIIHLDYIYDIKEDDLLELDGFSNKKAENLLKSIEKSKNPELWRFIYALSIDNVGKKTAKDLAKRYKTIEALRKCKKEELLKIEDFGDIVADSVIDYFKNHDWDVECLLEFVKPKEVATIGNKYSGLTFVITGTLKNPRNYYVEIIENNGGKVSNSVSKKTNVVLIGNDAGSKETKARELVSKGEKILILDTQEAVDKYFK